MMLQSEDGFTAKYDGKVYICYNDNKCYGRINNTLVHESAHIILGHSEESDLAEAEANFFAKYAIAPPALIHKLGLKSAIEIYNHFAISIEAARYAYNYYYKWLTYGNKHYTDYELRLLQLFDKAV
jgi:Zn-dependent peptidase ImmA (M78 family)